jgi:hypothetical protein
MIAISEPSAPVRQQSPCACNRRAPPHGSSGKLRHLFLRVHVARANPLPPGSGSPHGTPVLSDFVARCVFSERQPRTPRKLLMSAPHRLNDPHHFLTARPLHIAVTFLPSNCSTATQGARCACSAAHRDRMPASQLLPCQGASPHRVRMRCCGDQRREHRCARCRADALIPRCCSLRTHAGVTTWPSRPARYAATRSGTTAASSRQPDVAVLTPDSHAAAAAQQKPAGGSAGWPGRGTILPHRQPLPPL